MVREIEPQEAVRLIDGGADLVDVREPHEWAAGHAPDARHVPLATLDAADLPAGQPLLVICRSGQRSARAVMDLSSAGREAINVAGGMLAWRDAGLPIVTDNGAPGSVA